jgi:hypothetical protein
MAKADGAITGRMRRQRARQGGSAYIAVGTIDAKVRQIGSKVTVSSFWSILPCPNSDGVDQDASSSNLSRVTAD